MKNIALVFFATLAGCSQAEIPLQQMDPLFIEQKINHVRRVAFFKKVVGIGFATITTAVLTTTLYLFFKDQFATHDNDLPQLKQESITSAVQSDAPVPTDVVPVVTALEGAQQAAVVAASFAAKVAGAAQNFLGAVKSGVRMTIKQVPVFFVQATLAPVAHFISQKVFSTMNAQWALGNYVTIGNKIVYKTIDQDTKEVIQSSGEARLAKKNILFSAYMLNPDEAVQFEEKNSILSFIGTGLYQDQVYYKNSFAINVNALIDSLGQLVGLIRIKVQQKLLRDDTAIIADELIGLTNYYTTSVTSMQEQNNYNGLLQLTVSFLALTEDKIQTFMHLEG